MKTLVLISALFAAGTWDESELLKARTARSTDAREVRRELRASADKVQRTQWRSTAALAESYTAEVAIESETRRRPRMRRRRGLMRLSAQ